MKFVCTHCDMKKQTTICDCHGDPHDHCPNGQGVWTRVQPEREERSMTAKQTPKGERELRKEILELKVSLSNAKLEAVEAKTAQLASVGIVNAAIELNTEYMDHPWSCESVFEAGKQLFQAIKEADRAPKPKWQREVR